MFERAAGGPDAWSEVEQLLASDGLSQGYFGAAVALADQTRIIGAWGDAAARGAVYVKEAPPWPEEPPGPAFHPPGSWSTTASWRTQAAPCSAPLTARSPRRCRSGSVRSQRRRSPCGRRSRLLSAFYNVGAVTTTRVRGEKRPSALALPVPRTPTYRHLAIAILDARGTRYSRVPRPAAISGAPILGVYNPDVGLFSVALPELSLSGSIVVLIEHPDVAPLPMADAEAHLLAPTPDFSVHCQGFADRSKCMPQDEKTFATYLKDAFQRYSELSYTDPALRKSTAKVTTNLEIVKNGYPLHTRRHQ